MGLLLSIIKNQREARKNYPIMSDSISGYLSGHTGEGPYPGK
jgi:hypothetical protein